MVSGLLVRIYLRNGMGVCVLLCSSEVCCCSYHLQYCNKFARQQLCKHGQRATMEDVSQ
jgi:hypothetical protein